MKSLARRVAERDIKECLRQKGLSFINMSKKTYKIVDTVNNVVMGTYPNYRAALEQRALWGRYDYDIQTIY